MFVHVYGGPHHPGGQPLSACARASLSLCGHRTHMCMKQYPQLSELPLAFGTSMASLSDTASSASMMCDRAHHCQRDVQHNGEWSSCRMNWDQASLQSNLQAKQLACASENTAQLAFIPFVKFHSRPCGPSAAISRQKPAIRTMHSRIYADYLVIYLLHLLECLVMKHLLSLESEYSLIEYAARRFARDVHS